MITWLKRNLPVGLLIVLVAVLFFANYVPGTWLSGWDTLHPEFNWPLYFTRTIFSAWQQTYGLGVVPIQAYASELPRLLILFPMSLVFPASFLRYGYFFLCLIAGTLGAYFFISDVFKSKALAFIGTLTYLCNLGTLQIFFLPFEMNITHFATLPWVFLAATKYIRDSGKRNLIFLAVASFFTAPIAHTPTLFFVFFGCLILYVVVLSLGNWSTFKRALLLLLTVLVMNSFWLLPSAYSILTQGSRVTQSKINQQFSPIIEDTEKRDGTLVNTALFKNVFFDWGQYDNRTGSFEQLLPAWGRHLKDPLVMPIGYGIFVVAIIGIFSSIHDKNRFGLALLPGFIIAFCALANGSPVISLIFSLAGHVPLLQEALRFTLTKFTLLTVFPFAVFVSLGFGAISELISRWFNKKAVLWLMIIIFTAGLIYYFFPAFTGNFFDKKMRVNFPQEYFNTINWLNGQPGQGRVADFPVASFWAWNYYHWGYEGSGFWWFGLDNPLLDREQDRWSQYNENYYWEISQSIYSQNTHSLETVLGKYQIQWLVVDENVVSPTSPASLYFDQTEKLFTSSSRVSLAKKFGKIIIYRVSLQSPINNYVYASDNLPGVEPNYSWNDQDLAFSNVGNYVSSQKPDYYYPFRSLFTRDIGLLPFNFQEANNSLVFKANLPSNLLSDHLLSVPPSDQGKIQVYGNTLTVEVPPTGKYKLNYDNLLLKNCDTTHNGVIKNTLDNNKVRLYALDANNCSAAFYFPAMSQQTGYLLVVTAQNIAGRPLNFWVENRTSRRIDNQSFLPISQVGSIYYYVQPPMDPYGLGYNFHFDNTSIGRQPSINDLGPVEIYQIPYSFLSEIVFVPKSVPIPTTLSFPAIWHPNPVLYRVDLSTADQQTLVLNQAFNRGWIAISKNGILGDHVLVDNWANGWEVPAGRQVVYLFFWPQLLEFAGFGVLTIGLIGVIIFLASKKGRAYASTV
ncbi:MAG: hypothetical protein M1484_04845 [Patescibacteria group bacterium]|nr:hypothetical protein [Patescibacteria group bacterium]